MGYDGADAALKSIYALAKHFGGEMTDWGIDWFNTTYNFPRFEMPEMNSKEIMSILKQLGKFDSKTLKGLGECKLTGYFADESAIDGFRQAFASGIRDLGALMQAAFNSWLKAEQEECEASFGDERLGENFDCNLYTFHEDGSLNSF